MDHTYFGMHTYGQILHTIKKIHVVYHFNPQHTYYFSEESWKLRESCRLVGVYVSYIIILYVSSFSLCAFVNSFL